MERSEQRRILEALVLSSPEPVAAARLASVVPGGTPGLVRELVTELNAEYEAQERAFEICEVGGGYQIRTRVDLSEHVKALQPKRTVRLSRASLETLAVVAYKQPVTRAEIEHVRGVDAGAVVRTLLERNLVRIAGHREIPGRPMLYATTKRFLEIFGLASLEDLPTLRELEELLPSDPSSAVSTAPDETDESDADDDGSPDSEDDGSDGALFGQFETAYAEVTTADDDDSEDEARFEDAEPRGEPH